MEKLEKLGKMLTRNTFEFYGGENASEFHQRDRRLIVPGTGNYDGGKAYALFDFEAPKGEIYEELTDMLKTKAQKSGEPLRCLELSLRDVGDLQTSEDIDPDVLDVIERNSIFPTFPEAYKHQMETARPIKMKNLKYMIDATCPDATNEDAANELGWVLNGLYNRFGESKPFNTAITAKIDGEYLFKE